MADYSKRTVVTTREEFVLPSPADWSDLYKVLAVLQQDDRVGDFDDAVQVTARDDEIVLSFEVETRQPGS